MAVHERGSHGSRVSVAPLGAERLGLLASGPGTVVVVVDPIAVEAPVVVVVEAPGTDVEGVALTGGVTAKLEPVTTTMLGVTEDERAEPTSMVLLVVAVDPGKTRAVTTRDTSGAGDQPWVIAEDYQSRQRRLDSESVGQLAGVGVEDCRLGGGCTHSGVGDRCHVVAELLERRGSVQTLVNDIAPVLDGDGEGSRGGQRLAGRVLRGCGTQELGDDLLILGVGAKNSNWIADQDF